MTDHPITLFVTVAIHSTDLRKMHRRSGEGAYQAPKPY